MENKTITITEEQFRNAVTKANDNWMEISQKAKGDIKPMTLMITGMQNMLFGAELGKVLFCEDSGEKTESEDKE